MLWCRMEGEPRDTREVVPEIGRSSSHLQWNAFDNETLTDVLQPLIAAS